MRVTVPLHRLLVGLHASFPLSGNPERTATAPMAAKHNSYVSVGEEEDDSNKVR